MISSASEMPSDACTFEDVLAAADRIEPYVHLTPTLTSSTIDRLAGKSIIFKCEHLQKTGSFKYRGATNAILKLDSLQASRGVVTHSSGNHAQALALAAHSRGIAATIVMPSTSSAVKKAAVLEYGATIAECSPTLQSREEAVRSIAEQTGAVVIPPFDHPDVIAGQGTVALELLRAHPDLDAIVTPVGGGGLAAGICLSARGINPRVCVFGAEPAGADDAARSKALGKWVPQTNPETIADGLRTSLGQLTWPIIRDQMTEIFTVSELEIAAAMKLIWLRMKQLIEPSAAVGVAVAFSERFNTKTYGMKKVGVILCGGNVELETAFRLLR